MAMKPKFDPRTMMAMAIEVMNDSIKEPRADGKASPVVGAVLIRPDGKVDTAHRGELRDGDHAEFTLLERKNRAVKLDGSFLFATLEPCAPGARNHPKLSCAERIVLARIKKVWVGISDPDPTVDRKGIKYLQDNGVEVLMFDRDLQDQITKANGAFIAQAETRAAAVEGSPAQEAVLSEYENVDVNLVYAGLDPNALGAYGSALGETQPFNSDGFRSRLRRQDLLKLDEAELLKPTGFGTLLFGKFPRDSIAQAGLLATIHYDNGTEEVKDFDGPMVFIPDQAMRWLRDKLPNPIDRSDARRKGLGDKFFELVREGIVNALVHRDYSVKGAKCQLVITTDTVVVKSPGKPVLPVTVAQLQDFSAPMLSRNPILHLVFARMELAEERGLGLKSMKSRATEAGLPLPKYGWEAPYLVLTLYRSAASAVQSLGKVLLESLSADEKAAWALLSLREFVTSLLLVEELGFDERKVQRILKKFIEAKLIRRISSGRATKYTAVQK